jgi:hypothetical protein
MNAFEYWLVESNRDQAVAHVIDCLKSGDLENHAWDLMEKFNGPKWSCAPLELPKLVYKTLEKLEAEYSKNA